MTDAFLAATFLVSIFFCNVSSSSSSLFFFISQRQTFFTSNDSCLHDSAAPLSGESVPTPAAAVLSSRGPTSVRSCSSCSPSSRHVPSGISNARNESVYDQPADVPATWQWTPVTSSPDSGVAPASTQNTV